MAVEIHALNHAELLRREHPIDGSENPEVTDILGSLRSVNVACSPGEGKIIRPPGEELEPLRGCVRSHQRRAGDISAWSREVRDKTGSYGITH